MNRVLKSLTSLVLIAVSLTAASSLERTASADLMPLSPQEFFEKGYHVHGAFDVNDVTKCSPLAKFTKVGLGFMTNDQVSNFSDKDGKVLGSLSVKSHVTETVGKLNQLIDLLIANGDETAAQHHVCVGLYNYGTINAKSYEQGYIAADPLLIYEVSVTPGDTALSNDMIYAHEFGHQIQFSHLNPFLLDRIAGLTSRRNELSADCLGAAMLTLRMQSADRDQWESQAPGILETVKGVADLDYTGLDHHGTYLERMRAAMEGIDIVTKFHKTHLAMVGVTGQYLMNACNSFIMTEM